MCVCECVCVLMHVYACACVRVCVFVCVCEFVSVIARASVRLCVFVFKNTVVLVQFALRLISCMRCQVILILESFSSYVLIFQHTKSFSADLGSIMQ